MDSLSAIRALQTLHKHSHHLLHSIAELLTTLPPLYVTLEWVPGHMGLPGNTKADSSDRSTYLIQSISSLFPSAFELCHLVRDKYFQLWSRPGSGRTNQKPCEPSNLSFALLSCKMSHAPARSRSSICVSAPPSSPTVIYSMDRYCSVNTANASILKCPLPTWTNLG